MCLINGVRAVLVATLIVAVSSFTVQNSGPKKLLLVSNEFITPITDLKSSFLRSSVLLHDSKERSLVNHLDEAIIGESLVEEVKYSDNETLEEIEAIFENSNNDSSNNKESRTSEAQISAKESKVDDINNSTNTLDNSIQQLEDKSEADVIKDSEKTSDTTERKKKSDIISTQSVVEISKNVKIDETIPTTKSTTVAAQATTTTVQIALNDDTTISAETTSTATSVSKTTPTAKETTTTSGTTASETTPTATTAKETTTAATTASNATTTEVETTTEADNNKSHPLPSWAYALISIVIAALLIGVLFFFFLKYRRKQIPLAKPISSMLRKSTIVRSPQPIRVKDFKDEYQIRLSNFSINEEFERVQEHSARINASKMRRIGQEEKNRNRNRFVDIIPFDDNLVLLDKEEGHPASNYINASYIKDVPGISQVIATQGPKQNTVVEFWRMVLEKKCKHLINLTNTTEGGRVKCYQYWPPNGQMLHFDDISLFTQEEIEINTGLFFRKIEVQMGDEEECETHTVQQLHLTTWPDHSVPNNISYLLEFLRVTEEFGYDGYTIVHCSAGVGRTGTYLALRSLISQSKLEDEVDVMKTVFKLRSQRPKLVQTFEQYVLLYQVLSVYLAKEEGLCEDSVDISGDIVLDAGIENFGFEHVKL